MTTLNASTSRRRFLKGAGALTLSFSVPLVDVYSDSIGRQIGAADGGQGRVGAGHPERHAASLCRGTGCRFFAHPDDLRRHRSGTQRRNYRRLVLHAQRCLCGAASLGRSTRHPVGIGRHPARSAHCRHVCERRRHHRRQWRQNHLLGLAGGPIAATRSRRQGQAQADWRAPCHRPLCAAP